MNKIISIKNLSYGSILDSINLDIYENTINYISGSNNCGKNTFIKTLCGDIDIKNSIFYENKDIATMSSCEVSMLVGKVITLNTKLNMSTVSQELLYKLDKLNLEKKEHKNRYNNIISRFKLKSILSQNPNELSIYNKLKLLISLELIKKPKILFISGVFTYIKKKNMEDLFEILKSIENLTIIISNTDLNLCLYSDYLHLFHRGKLILSGKTIEVLKKDSIINKLGLDLPFMVDLSIKLKYYDLVDDIELDMNRMVNKLWK